MKGFIVSARPPPGLSLASGHGNNSGLSGGPTGTGSGSEDNGSLDRVERLRGSTRGGGGSSDTLKKVVALAWLGRL